MKIQKFLAALFILVILFAVYSCSKDKSAVNTLEELSTIDQTITTRGEFGEACTPALTNCIHGVYAWVIELPQYPGCSFEVEVDYSQCTGLGNVVAIHLGDFEITNHNCQDFTDDYNDALTNGTFESFIVTFNQSVWRVVTENLILSLTPPTTIYVLEVEYLIGGCKFACGANIVDCGEACCRKINRYEYISDRWVLTVEGDIERFGECDTAPFCDPNSLQTSGCYDNCQSLDF